VCAAREWLAFASMFVLTWAVALLVWRFARIEERFSAREG